MYPSLKNSQKITRSSFDIDKTWSCASCLAQRQKRKRLLGGNPRCFYFSSVLIIIFSLGACYFCSNSIVSLFSSFMPSFCLYWKKVQEPWCVVHKQILYPSLKNSQKITRSSFWYNFFVKHGPGNCLDLISFLVFWFEQHECLYKFEFRRLSCFGWLQPCFSILSFEGF